MSKMLSVLFITILSFGLTLLVMINGWGLTVKSWGWLIFGVIANIFLYGLLSLVNKE